VVLAFERRHVLVIMPVLIQRENEQRIARDGQVRSLKICLMGRQQAAG
jgi:hypothetical protein